LRKFRAPGHRPINLCRNGNPELHSRNRQPQLFRPISSHHGRRRKHFLGGNVHRHGNSSDDHRDFLFRLGGQLHDNRDRGRDGQGTISPTGSVSFLDTSNINYVAGSAMLGAPTLAQTFTAQVTSATDSGPDAVAVGDINGDGNPDVVVANDGGATAGVLLKVVTQTTNATESGIAVPGSGTHAVSSSYAGAANFSSSASSTVSLTATPVATTLTLTAN
jgi:hypothetical protein